MRVLERVRVALGSDLGLGTLLERLAAVHGDRPLVTELGPPDLHLTVAEAADLVDRWAGAVAARTEPGDVVVIATANGYRQFLLTLATSRAGRIPAPLNSQLTAAEVDAVVADASATLVIRDPDELEPGQPLGEAARPDPGEVAALFYTSGTTGSPKGVELSHRALIGSSGLGALLPGWPGHELLVLALPVAHIYGFTALIGAACVGLPVRLLPRFQPVAVLDAIEAERASVFAGVPTMYRMLLEAGAAERDLTSVRLWISGADAIPPDLARTFKGFGATVTLPVVGPLGEAGFAEGYGLVETAGGVAVRVSPPLLPAALGHSLGVPLPGTRFKVVGEDGDQVGLGQVGELLVRGPNVLRGYHGAPEATAAALTDDGWLRTGDLARRGPLGLVNFEGRRKEVIKRGGYSVYPLEVERCLEEHPDVVEAAVVPLPDDRDGEVPVAVVRLAEGRTLADLDLAGWATGHLAAFKVPLRFHPVDEPLPKSANHKLLRREVRRRIQGEEPG